MVIIYTWAIFHSCLAMFKKNQRVFLGNRGNFSDQPWGECTNSFQTHMQNSTNLLYKHLHVFNQHKTCKNKLAHQNKNMHINIEAHRKHRHILPDLSNGDRKNTWSKTRNKKHTWKCKLNSTNSCEYLTRIHFAIAFRRNMQEKSTVTSSIQGATNRHRCLVLWV